MKLKNLLILEKEIWDENISLRKERIKIIEITKHSLLVYISFDELEEIINDKETLKYKVVHIEENSKNKTYYVVEEKEHEN